MHAYIYIYFLFYFINFTFFSLYIEFECYKSEDDIDSLSHLQIYYCV